MNRYEMSDLLLGVHLPLARRFARRFATRVVALSMLWLGPAETVRAAETIQFRDVTAESGIDFVHTHGGSDQRYIMEAMSAGLALFDYNGDGRVDIYFLNGSALRGTDSERPSKNALYRNDGGFRFTDVTEEAGAGDEGYGLGVAAADYDNDGDLDLYVNNFGPNVLYRNNGDGTFSDVTREAGIAIDNKVGAGACFLDVEGDGDLDLYVTNYVDFSYETHRPHVFMGLLSYPSPLKHSPIPDALYRNNGDGTFTDVSAESGIARHVGTGMGTIACDYDGDGDSDIYVANDVMGNFLLQNDGSGKFDDVGMFSGVALDMAGTPQGSMSTDFGDYDNDGRLDLLVTSYGGEMVALYRHLGDGLFEDVSRRTGVGPPTSPHVTWGAGFVDFDNDGDRDLFIACGHLDDNVGLRDESTAYKLPNILLMNSGDGRFVDVSASGGDGMQVRHSSRGAAFDDLDNDGDMDVVVLNSRSEPTVLMNESATSNHWLQVRLKGVRTNRDGVGARVVVKAGDLTQLDEVHSGRGYQSHWGLRLHFGLGPRHAVDRIEVHWIGGGVDVLEKVAVDRQILITED